jgi:hypothetical protein
MALKLVYPAAWTSGMVGRTLAANNPACALRAARMRSTAPAGPERAQSLPARRRNGLGALRNRFPLGEVIRLGSCATSGLI